MSVSGVFTSSLTNSAIAAQPRITNSEFQQLGQDLASGNLSAAQSDFAILQQIFSRPASSSPSTSASTAANPLGQDLRQLGSDLETNNLSAAQKDYTALQEDFQNLSALRHRHFHHHSPAGVTANPLPVNETSPPVQNPFLTTTAGLTWGATNGTGASNQLAWTSDASSSPGALPTGFRPPVSFLA